jgi:hypothetical protein
MGTSFSNTNEHLISRAWVFPPHCEEIVAEVVRDTESCTGLSVHLEVDRLLACVIRPHKRATADTIAMSLHGREEIGHADVYVPQRVMTDSRRLPRDPICVALDLREERAFMSKARVETYDDQQVDGAVECFAESTSGLALKLSLATGQTLILLPREDEGPIALQCVGRGRYGLVEVLVPQGVLSMLTREG